MSRKRVTMLLILLVVILSGCQAQDLVYEGPTKTVIDTVGREVEIPQDPMRIGALYAPTGHVVAMLDAGDKIVAVNNGLKRDKLFNELVPTIEDASMVIVSGQINIEELVNQSVDLAIIPLDVYTDSKQVDQLDKVGVPYLVVDFQSIEDQRKLITLLGEVLNAQEEAKTYLDFYETVIDKTNEALSEIGDHEKVNVYHSINEANCTVAKDTLPYDWMQIAGGVNVSLDGDLEKDGDKFYTNLEQIIYWNPQVIYCNESGVPDYIMNNTQWQDIDAVKNGQVKQLPVGISRWGHKTSLETPLAILYVARDLYPQAMADVDVDGMIQEFYLDLFEFEITDEQLEKVIAGDDMRLNKDLEEGK